ncbi:planctomycete cytochrome C domain protein [Rhodopirellula sp. SWK7]|nr:planctomycete cytochrome C domain protein [Rhodopirellula sp. SWK7]
MIRRWLIIQFVAMVLVTAPEITYASEIDFENDVYPILEDNCLFCHGEDEQESGLRLDRRGYMLRGGDSGLAAVVPEHPEKSYLIDVINHVDKEMAMPPDEDKIADEDIDLITRWIQAGAVWPGQMDDIAEEEIDHWAFLPPQTEFDQDCIDDFLREKLAGAGLSFSDTADARSLIRRASIVLTGLTPTPERTAQFIRAFAEDGDAEERNAAYENLIDELLASPHFGERWAQHWLDVIRWAETNGSESNLYRKNAWMYRDYVVRSFNEDKPYDEFIREQLAGDVLGHGDATGFLVAGPHVPAATVGQEPTAIRQARADRMDEVLQTVGASMMGVTIGCARCHNHKFDPISIQDYYSMSAAFQDVEFGSRFPELADDHPRVLRSTQLRSDLDKLREEMRSNGWAWVEDWTGYEEVHFPTQTIDEMRIVFNGRWVMLDEMEILEASGEHRNVLAPELGAVITDNPSTHVASQPTGNLNNGVFGTKGWRGVSKKGNKETPWLQFEFPKTVSVSSIRLSSNREDFLETDYLEGMNKSKYGDFNIEMRDANGQWRPFASTAAMRKKSTDNEQRQALQQRIQEVIGALIIEGPQPAFLAQFVEPVETFVLARGSPESPRDRVHAAAPKRLGGDLGIDPESPGALRRKAFADWLVSPENPLTARVMANRIWHHIFGSGIVPTPSDFGLAGAPPTHPELLDWLTGQFIESNWSMKSMVRMIVLSDAFKQSNAPNEAGLAKDATAQLLWRFPPRRVEAEVIRDSVLQASGRLDPTIGGPSYRIHNVKKRYAQWEVVDNHGDETWRRMLYQERMRRVDDRIFTAFDFPDCGQIRAKRPVSTTPLQALNLMNSDFVVTQATLLAERARSERGDAIDAQVIRCFELLLCRQPSQDDLEASIEVAKTQSLELLCRTLINTNEFAFLP